MATGNKDLARIPVFDGQDFSDWKYRMELIFEELKLLGTVQNRPTDVVRAAADFNDKARRIIAEGLSQMHLEYAKKPSAYEAWTNLCRNFEGKNAINRCINFEKLIYLRCDEDKPLHEFYKNFDKLLNEYTAAGGDLPDLEIITIFMTKIPKKFKHVKSALQTIASDEITMDRVRTRLLEEELQEQGESERDPANDDSSVGAAFKTQKKNAYKPKANVTCFNCGERGHKSNVCKNRSKNPNFKNKNVDRKDKPEGPGKFACIVKSLLSPKEDDEDQIIFAVDSGASDHLVNDLSILTNVREIPSFTIEVAKEGQSLSVSKGGAMPVLTFVKGREIELDFSNVCFVPGLSHNLLSVSRLDEFGFTFGIENGVLSCYKNEQLIFEAIKHNGLYWTSFEPLKHRAHASKKSMDLNELWHRPLGHINMYKVSKMANGAVNGIKKDITSELGFCECCVKCKQTRLPFNKKRNPATRPLERIHSDVCGPFPAETFDGYKYYVTFIDDFTHMCTTYLLKRKSEVFTCFKNYKNMVEAKFGAKISKLRCDCGGEYSSNEFKLQNCSSGIVIDFTPPYNPELNGVSERMNRTLCDKARCLLKDAGLNNEYWGDTYSLLFNESYCNRCTRW